uniref:Secreted protein n=1 Tax=Anguilla anguilla TaxID=7936 RepID=A0A0E9WYY9_ANGAN
MGCVFSLILFCHYVRAHKMRLPGNDCFFVFFALLCAFLSQSDCLCSEDYCDERCLTRSLERVKQV